MFNVIAGETSFGEVWAEGFAPAEVSVHVQVGAVRVLDMERYGESELTDLELVALAAEDAVEARRGGRMAGPALDEVGLRRAERRAERADLARALRTEGAIA